MKLLVSAESKLEKEPAGIHSTIVREEEFWASGFANAYGFDVELIADNALQRDSQRFLLSSEVENLVRDQHFANIAWLQARNPSV